MEPLSPKCVKFWAAELTGIEARIMIHRRGRNHSTTVDTCILIHTHHVHAAYHNMHTEREAHH
eukprot:1729315-Rhodomonas_salina.1